jgi:hypothetical protein
MNNIDKNPSVIKSHYPFLQPEKETGFYHSVSLTRSPEEVFAFCQDAQNIKKVLMDLPDEMDNFLNLNLLSATRLSEGRFEIIWNNLSDSTAKGTLTFMLMDAPLKRGTILTASAVFDNLDFKNDGPSSLMSVFMKRMKALCEVGVIATTKGQPSGREEKTLH